MNQYKLISKKGEGTFSEVLKAQSLKKGKYVAIKCMKSHFSSIDKVHNLREIQALKKLSPYEHIIKLIEILYDEPTGRLALVFELMDCNLYEHIKGRKHYLHPQKVKFYIFQLLKAIDHMHRNGIFHRDIKPENILLTGDHVKLADFGSCKGMYSEQPYTEYISTRWYRAPECLMTDGYYENKMDIWGVGCVMFEIIALFPLFPGKDELDQVHKIHKVLGSPNQEILERFKKRASHMEFNFPVEKGTGIDKYLQHVSKECIDLIKQLLTYDPDERITAANALRHEYFRDIHEGDIFQSMLLTMKNGRKPMGGGQSGDEKSQGNENSENEKFSKKGYNSNAKKMNYNNNVYKGMINHHEEEDKMTQMFPPIKGPVVGLDSTQKYKTGGSIKKIYDPKKLYGTMKKTNPQYNYNIKKPKKDNSVYDQYVLAGKKANIGTYN